MMTESTAVVRVTAGQPVFFFVTVHSDKTNRKQETQSEC